MNQIKSINDLQVGAVMFAPFNLIEFTEGSTGKGDPYLRGRIGMHDGDVPFVFWDFKEMTVKAREELSEKLSETTFVWAQIEVSMYNDKIQAKVNDIVAIDQNDARITDLKYLIPVTGIDVVGAYNEMLSFVDQMNNFSFKTIAKNLLEENRMAFTTYPAAQKVHHDYQGGLIEHTYEMFKLAIAIADNLIYKDILDIELLVTGVIAHDAMKIKEYEVNSIKLATGFSKEGLYKGHIVLGAQEVSKMGEFLDQDDVLLVEHLVLSHHGVLEYGSPVEPVCLEAEILHHLDMISSRSAIYYGATKNIEPREFTDTKVFPLQRRLTRTK